ncbi:DUF58 domain-containing protein [Thermococcus sp. 21S9]|uniref:DUF58 domain-containing protein n=1 Tax=Thermococcus sp. 21S9 TaxID=1638223 RepID=UPI00143AD0E8|nr:DUF58 domain-containing protein [Thermococcus sp. 21S9]NJE54586.1 DUF58 domain-containing protein [Thermococcus sp. 21S9]
MKREDFLVMTAFLLMLEGYLLGNVLPGFLGLVMLLYLLFLRSSTEFAVSTSVTFPEGPLEVGREYPLELNVKNFGSIVRLCPEVPARGLIVEFPESLLVKGEEKTLIGRMKVLEKGEVSIDRITLRIEEWHGLYFDELTLEGAKFQAYPSLEELKEEAKVDRNLRLAELYRAGRFFGLESLDFKDLREYQHGDDFRRIDWKASLRLGELIVREFLREDNVDVYIFLDNTREMRKGIRRAKIDYGSTLVLQLASVLLDNYNVGLVIYDEKSAKLLPARKGWTQLEAIRRSLGIKHERKVMSLRFEFSPNVGFRAREFLKKVFPMIKGRSGLSGIFEALSLIKGPAFIILITDLSNPRDVYRAVSEARKKHGVLILSPNPILFYSGTLDEKTLERLYKAYEERERLIKRFNALVPTIDLGPSDYLREISKVM